MVSKPKQTSTKKTDIDASENLPSEASVIEDKAVIDNVPNEVAASADHSHCGGVLHKMREAQNLSISDIASQLRLSGIQVEALEADEYNNLPEAMIVKGFIRNYAKLLKTPAEPLLDAYSAMVPDAKRHSLTLQSTANIEFSEPKEVQVKHYVTIVLVAALAGGIWLFYQNYIQKPSPVALSDTSSDRVAEIQSQVALPIEDSSATVEFLQEDTNKSTLDTVTTDVKTAEEDSMSAEADVEITGGNSLAGLDTELTTQKPLVNGKSRLEFDVTQETWVSVVSASGREIYNKTLFAGNHEVLDVWPPVKLVVGNANGATLKVNGEATDLAPYTRVNIARIPID